jgi:hypothetical protein
MTTRLLATPSSADVREAFPEGTLFRVKSPAFDHEALFRRHLPSQNQQDNHRRSYLLLAHQTLSTPMSIKVFLHCLCLCGM